MLGWIFFVSGILLAVMVAVALPTMSNRIHRQP